MISCIVKNEDPGHWCFEDAAPLTSQQLGGGGGGGERGGEGEGGKGKGKRGKRGI